MLFTVIWRYTYGKWPLRLRRRKPHQPHGLLFPISSKDNTCHGLCYTLAGTRNSSMGPPWRIDSLIHRTIYKRTLTTELLSYFRPTKFKTHYVTPQFLFFGGPSIIAPNFLRWNAHIFLFWLNPTGHSKFHNTSNTLRLLPIPVGLLVLPCTRQCRRSTLTHSPLFSLLSRTKEPAKAGICVHDRRALQQLTLTWPRPRSYISLLEKGRQLLTTSKEIFMCNVPFDRKQN